MDLYTRDYPLFSLCGLNCGLCPRLHTEGSSKCPGCGGEGFSEKHPACAVITCSKKHGAVQYCFLCEAFPCQKYQKESPVDSFITYKNVLADMEKAREDLSIYKKELEERQKILDILLKEYNEGRSKALYCLAASLIPLHELEMIMKRIEQEIDSNDMKERAKEANRILKEHTERLGIVLVLRK